MIKEGFLNIKDGDLIAFSSAYKIKHFLKKPARYLIHWLSYLENRDVNYDDVPEHIATFCKGYVYERLIEKMRYVTKKTSLSDRLKGADSQIEIRHYPLRKKLDAKESRKLEAFLKKELKSNSPQGITQAFYTVLDKLPFMKLVKISEKYKSCSKFVFRAYQAAGRIASYYNANKYSPIEVLNFAKKERLVKNQFNRIDK